MAFEVEIFNYKTIKHVKYTIDGYTLLIGKNFIGKSAAIQAIVAAFKNAEGEGFIRRGEKFCEVRIHHNGDSVIWHKEKGNNFYVINYQGKLYDLKKSLGRGEVPQPVISMGFGPLLISGEKAYLWYAKQFETLFLVDKPRQNFTTDLIASVADLDAIYKATDMVKKELSAKKSDLKLRATDLKDAREQAKEYSALDQYESGEAAIQALVDSIGLLGREIESLGSIEREFEQGLAVAQKLSPASSLEVLSTTSLDSLYLEINTLYRIHKEFLEASAQEAKYLPISEIKEDLNGLVPPLESAFKEISKVSSLEAEFVSAEKALSRLGGSEKVEDLQSPLSTLQDAMGSFAQVSALEKEYRESLASFTRYSTIEKSLETLSLPEAEAKELSVVSSILTEYEGALQEFHLAQAEFKRISLELHQAQRELDEFKECPLCGGNLCLH